MTRSEELFNALNGPEPCYCIPGTQLCGTCQVMQEINKALQMERAAALDEAAMVAEACDKLTCAQWEAKYGPIDMANPETGKHIAQAIRQLKSSPHETVHRIATQALTQAERSPLPS